MKPRPRPTLPPQPAADHWMVAAWPEGSCQFAIVSAYPTREAGMAAAARHPGAQLVFRAMPAPTFDPQGQF